MLDLECSLRQRAPRPTADRLHVEVAEARLLRDVPDLTRVPGPPELSEAPAEPGGVGLPAERTDASRPGVYGRDPAVLVVERDELQREAASVFAPCSVVQAQRPLLRVGRGRR